MSEVWDGFAAEGDKIRNPSAYREQSYAPRSHGGANGGVDGGNGSGDGVALIAPFYFAGAGFYRNRCDGTFEPPNIPEAAEMTTQSSITRHGKLRRFC